MRISTDNSPLLILRGEIVHFIDDPLACGARAYVHFPDGLLLVRDGHVLNCGPAAELEPNLPVDARRVGCSGKLILPGFIDTHTHCAQTEIIASHSEQLTVWLEKYAWPAETRHADPAYAAAGARFFCDQLLRHGTTTAMVFTTVHPACTEALFEAAFARRMRMIAGKVLMDRNCPEPLRDTPTGGDTQSRVLIEKWHGRGRLAYAVTPRFAPTSTEEQMHRAGRLFGEIPGLYLQTHLAEQRTEVAWAMRLYPGARSYLDIYERFHQLGERSVFAHCIWLDDEDRRRMAARGASMSFCPTSNLFLGSGLFDLGRARDFDLHVGLGSDIGAGTSFSMLQTLNEAYKVLRLTGQTLTPEAGFYLATLGGARALHLDMHIGNFLPGREADFIVLDPRCTPLLEARTSRATTFAERLFALMMLGDDRCVAATYVLGEPVFQRDVSAPPLAVLH
ncbi:MAG: guanine deaminase [Betaproteobacteria bacterium]|nr:guanine deaminase [Betaproteobacteria bacterium]